MASYAYFIHNQTVRTLSTSQFDSCKPIGKIFLEKWFSKYYVNVYRPINSGFKNSEYGVKYILDNFVDSLHPEKPFGNKHGLIRFIKLITSALCSRLRNETECLKDPNYEFKHL